MQAALDELAGSQEPGKATVLLGAYALGAGLPMLASEPLRMKDLRGKVVLVESWTYSCINCIHVMPHVTQWHARYATRASSSAASTCRNGYERSSQNVESAVKRFGIKYAVAQDNGYIT